MKNLPNVIDLFLNNDISGFSMCDYIFIHKFIDWQYEKEWRLIFNCGCWFPTLEQFKDFDEQVWDSAQFHHFIKPSRILLGYKISKAGELLLKKIGNDLKIPVLKMHYDESGVYFK